MRGPWFEGRKVDVWNGQKGEPGESGETTRLGLWHARLGEQAIQIKGTQPTGTSGSLAKPSHHVRCARLSPQTRPYVSPLHPAHLAAELLVDLFLCRRLQRDHGPLVAHVGIQRHLGVARVSNLVERCNEVCKAKVAWTGPSGLSGDGEDFQGA